ncbi:MAG: ADOP family duplicated permease [Acidobacteriota bacterium]
MSDNVCPSGRTCGLRRAFLFTMNDLRFAFRRLLKSPGFTAVAVLSLALAVGVNSGVFTIVNGLFFRPLVPVRPEEIVTVFTARAAADRAYRDFSFAEFSLLREAHEVFADAAAFRMAAVGIARRAGSAVQRRVAYVVSDNFFSMQGVKPVAGRFFLPEEGRPNADIPVAVVSRRLWERLVGKSDFSPCTVSINGETWNIVGVVPAGFSGGNALLAPDVWLPLGMAARVEKAFAPTRSATNLADPATCTLHVIGRLQPGLTLEAAKARLPALGAQLTTIAFDAADGPRDLEIEPRSRFAISTEPSHDGPLGLFGALLVCMAGVVLLVACLNLANMFLARNLTRSHELAVRLALGASRWRVVRVLAVEGLIVAMLGGGAGLLLSSWADGFLLHSLTNNTSLAALGFGVSLDVTPDIRVLLATLVFCAAAILVFAVGPAWHIARDAARGTVALHQATRTTTDRWGRLFSGRHCLLMAQLALSLVLLFSAGLFFRAADAAARLDPGFIPEGDLIAELDYSLVDRDDVGVLTSVEALAEALRSDPAVRRVALATHIPFGNVNDGFDLSAPGGSHEQPRRARGTETAVSAGYFDTLGVKLLRGRDFTEREWRDPNASSVVILDERAAAELFPDRDPVGQYVERPRSSDGVPSEPIRVIGVVSAHWNKVFEDGPPARAFFPLAGRHPRHVFIHLRGQTADAVASGTLAKHVRSRLTALDPSLPLVRLAPYSTIIDHNIELWSVRFAATLFGAFGAIALLLAVVGVYGVKAFGVARRTREFGIRVALGARPSQIYALLMKQGAVQIAIALSVGLLLSLAAGRLLASMLLRVSADDPVVLMAAAIPLALTALLATWLPARRATRVNPVKALRTE